MVSAMNSELMRSRGLKPRRGVVKTCSCGKQFYAKPSDAGKRYCSNECRRSGGRSPKLVERSCVECGALYLAAHKDRKFCSQQCADKRRYVPSGREKAGGEVACSYCGTKLWRHPNKLRDHNSAFCNKDHQVLYLKENAHRQACAICGQEFFCQPCQVTLRNRATCSKRCAAVMAERKAQERRASNPPTQGVINRRIRASARMQRWRRAVFGRDNYTCQLCGTRGGYLEADHIKPFAYYPALRFSLENGRTLCGPCHKSTPTYGERAKRLAGQR